MNNRAYDSKNNRFMLLYLFNFIIPTQMCTNGIIICSQMCTNILGEGRGVEGRGGELRDGEGREGERG